MSLLQFFIYFIISSFLYDLTMAIFLHFYKKYQAKRFQQELNDTYSQILDSETLGDRKWN